MVSISVVSAHMEHKLPASEKNLKLENKDINLTSYQQEALRYLQEEEDSSWEIKQSCFDENTGMTTISLLVNSITWPKKNNCITSNHPQWVHRVNIYIPKNANKNTALLQVGNGILYPTAEHPDSVETLGFAKIAQDTNSVVIEVRDIPNQFLAFTEKHGDKLIEINGKREDDLFMYTWVKYLTNPQEHAYMPLHIVMAKATIRTMSACQDFLLKQKNITINNFVLSGISKRGWVAWLVAAFDARVTALMPVVCDFLDLNNLIKTMQQPENSKYASAGMVAFFHPYLSTTQMQKLFNLVDPIGYQQFISMPKYIISSVGEKYVPPEINQNYLHHIEEKNLKVFPNTGHFLDKNNSELLTSAMQSFYAAIIYGKKLPSINYNFDGKLIQAESTVTPKKVLLHTITSKTNNFITDCSTITTDITIEKTSNKFAVPINAEENKPSLYILEFHYNNDSFEDFIITTPAFKQNKN
jgi:PhoPQ-activated pathogenicity-related protein